MRFEIRKQSFRVSERLSDWVMDDSHLRKERRGGERERERERQNTDLARKCDRKG